MMGFNDNINNQMIGRQRQKSTVMIGYEERMEAWPTVSPTFKKNSLWQKIMESIWIIRFLEFSKNSTMHGLRYIGDRSLHIIERSFWIGSFLLAVGSSSYFITHLFNKYNDMPVIVSLSPTPITLNDIPFPAVTVCNMNNMRKSEAEKIIKAAEDNSYNDADLEEKMVYDFCNRPLPKKVKNETGIKVNTSVSWEYIQKFMVNISQPCHEMFMYCEWHTDKQECMEFFNPSLSDEGICCVFNRLKRDHIFRNPRDLSDLNITFPGESYDWSPEKGFPNNLSAEVLPRRAKGAGSQMGLTIVVNAELKEYFCATDNSQGFKVMLSNPIETPKVASFALSIEPGKETKIVVTPKIIISTEQLRDIDSKKRKCYFEKEKHLFFYRTYSLRNCNLECEANFTIALCGCVLYHMPKNSTTRICGKMDQSCSKNAQKIIELNGADYSTELNTNELQDCHCLPACNEVSYGSKLSSSRITDALMIDEQMMGPYNTSYFVNNMAIIHIYFLEKQFTTTVRGVIFGFTEFLSNTGGLLGLFFGFSFLSAVEIVYFLTLRVICEKHKHKKDDNELHKIKVAQLNIEDPKTFLRLPYPYTK